MRDILLKPEEQYCRNLKSLSCQQLSWIQQSCVIASNELVRAFDQNQGPAARYGVLGAVSMGVPGCPTVFPRQFSKAVTYKEQTLSRRGGIDLFQPWQVCFQISKGGGGGRARLS